MSFGIRTCLRIAVALPSKADFLLGSQDNSFKLQALLSKLRKSLLSYCSGYGLGCQVKESSSLALPHRLYSRKYSGNGFSSTGWCLNKEFLLVIDGLVHIRHQFLLSCAIGKREGKRLDAFYLLFMPFHLVFGPFCIPVHQIQIIILQFLVGVLFKKIANFLCIQITVGHSHSHFFFFIFSCIKERITLRLSQMYRHRFFHFIHVLIDSFDFVYGNQWCILIKPIHDAIRPTVYK